jgi:hypothetical protein
MAMGRPSPVRRCLGFARKRVLLWTLVLLPGAAGAQQDFNTVVLEPEYRRAQAEYDAAFNALVALEGRLNQALEDLDQARASEDEARMNRAYNLVLTLSGDLREQRRRVDQKATELRDARFQLLQALRRRVDALIAQVDSTRSEADSASLAAILNDVNNRRMELLAEEEPETVLEPMRDITISPTDLPIDIRRRTTGRTRTRLGYWGSIDASKSSARTRGDPGSCPISCPGWNDTGTPGFRWSRRGPEILLLRTLGSDRRYRIPWLRENAP